MLNNSMIINHPVPVIYRKNNSYEIVRNLIQSSEYVKDQADSLYCNNHDVYLIRVAEPALFRQLPILDIIDTDTLNKIRNKELILAIDATHEANYEMVNECYNIIIEHNIPESQLLLVADSPKLIEYISKKADELNREPIKFEYYSFGEKLAQKLIRSITYEQVPTIKSPLLQDKFDKKFINLNRIQRPHRCLLLTLLHQRNLIKEGYVSFNEMSNTYYTARMMTYPSFDYRISETELKEILPLVLDDYPRSVNPCYASQRPLYKFYRNSYFSVVTETQFATNTYPNFLSEKTFKAISHKHPFLIVATTGILRMIRQLGYKTFDGIIDESYDDIEDDVERLTMIANEIERLCNLNEEQLTEFKRQALDIVEYNYNLLMSKTNFLNQI